MTAPNLAIGTILAGRYTVHALLGKRAGRATYHCITAPNRHVAVKLLDPALAHGDAQAALAMAAAAAAELPDGAVLRVVDRGVDPDTGAPFFVSPLSDHPSLEAFVSLCPLSLQEMATMARSLARGLDAAHRRGLAHLALRPTNTFVGPPPVCWTRVADFGSGAVDRALGLGADRDTLAFAAPELYAAEAAPLTSDGAARADVFSAALLCFYAATGDTYWKTTRRKGGAPSTAGLAPLVQEATGLRAPASVAAREIGAAWNPALDAAFARALSSAPSSRYGSVGELADALADALQLPRRGGAAGLADSLVKGEPAPQTMLDEDDEPATRMAAPPALAHAVIGSPAEQPPSMAPPPESIAPTGPRTGAPRGLGGTMILDAGPETAPSGGLVSKVPPPAAVPAFGGTSGAYPLPPPHPSMAPGATPTPMDAAAPAVAPRRSRAPLVLGAAVVLLGAAGALAVTLRGGRGGGPHGTAGPPTPPAATAMATATAAPSSAPRAAESQATTPHPPPTGGASTAEPAAAPTASAQASAAAPEPPASESPREGPIPTTYGLQPKPKVEQLDPPTTWFAELIVQCDPKCDVVLVQGGPSPNPEVPKQLPPGTYTVTVRQSGGIQSQAAVLRAATRTTFYFDGKLVIPEAVKPETP